MTTLYSYEERVWQSKLRFPPWHRAEAKVRDQYDLIEDHGPHYDARERDGTSVEIKSCVAFRADGSPGRFEIWESQIDDLLHDGKVALLVHDPGNRYLVVAMQLVPVTALLGTGTVRWWEHPTMGYQPRKCIPWPELIPLTQTTFYFRRTYTSLFDEEEVDNAILPKMPDPEAEADGG